MTSPFGKEVEKTGKQFEIEGGIGSAWRFGDAEIGSNRGGVYTGKGVEVGHDILF